MKRITFILFLFIFINQICSQSIKFNNIYGDSVYLYKNIVIRDTGYIVVGGGGDPLYILSAFIDTIGDLKWSKKIKNSGYNLWHGRANSLKFINNSASILVGTKIKVNSNEHGVLLIKFNSDFDTLWSHVYLIDTFYRDGQNCIVTSDKGFVIIGEKNLNGSNAQLLLIKTDSLGNMLWNKNYGGGYSEYGINVIETYDKDLLAGGWSNGFTTAPIYNAGEWYLLKTDSIGTYKWQNHYGNPLNEDGPIRSLIQIHDTCYLLGGSIAFNQGYKARLLKLNKNLQFIWDRNYLTPSGWTAINTTIELTNSTIISTGIEQKNGKIYGFVMKLNSNGDIIWKRNYMATDNINSMNNALAIATTADKGFAFTGYVVDNQLTPPQQAWLVKTDSLGCDGTHSCDDTTMFVSVSNLSDTVCFGDSVNITLCFGGRSAPYTLQSSTGFVVDSIYYFDTGNDTITRSFSILPQQENVNDSFTIILTDPWGATKTENFNFYVKHCSTSVASNREDILKYQIFPNPAKEILIITSTENIPSLIFLLNMQSEILTQTYLQNKTEINLNNFSQGIYFVKIVSEKGVLIKKFVKE